MTAQAVSKAIGQLETHLGTRLFHRTTRSSTLTEDGRQFLDAVTPQLEGLQRVLSGARNASSDEQGIIRIAAAGPVGRRVLLPLLASFRAAHPRVEVELILEERFSDLVSERIDVGFRAGSPPENQVIARRLFPIQDIPCAAPAYLEAAGVPVSIEQLSNHRCTGYRNPSTGRLLPWEFQVRGEIQVRNVAAVFSTNDPEAEMEAVASGFGIGMIDSINAAPRIRSGGLVPLFVDKISDRRGLYIYYGQRDNLPRRVRIFIDFAIGELLDNHEFVLTASELRKYARKNRTQTT